MGRISSYTNDRLTFEVVDAGPEDGDVVVLLHGFPQRASSWAEVTPPLNAAGLRTLAPDLRGYSPGARPTRRRDYNLELIVEDVVALIRRVGQPVHLVGHDWGSALAWAVAGMHPDLVRTLTAVSVPHPMAFTEAGWGQYRKSWYMLFNQLPGLTERFLADRGKGTMIMEKAKMPQPVIDRFFAEVVNQGAARTAVNWYRGMPFTPQRILRTRVQAPTTMVWSDGDSFIHIDGIEGSRRFVKNDYRVEILEGVSHWIPDEVPERLAQIILDRVADG